MALLELVMPTFETRLTHPSGLRELPQLLGQAQQVLGVPSGPQTPLLDHHSVCLD